jgi:hypothetical protein
MDKGTKMQRKKNKGPKWLFSCLDQAIKMKKKNYFAYKYMIVPQTKRERFGRKY